MFEAVKPILLDCGFQLETEAAERDGVSLTIRLNLTRMERYYRATEEEDELS